MYTGQKRRLFRFNLSQVRFLTDLTLDKTRGTHLLFQNSEESLCARELCDWPGS